MTEYLALFGASFLAATIVPFYSEVLLIGLLDGERPLWLLVGVATVGNTLGAVVNWALGKYLLHFQDRRWFPFRAKDIERAQRWYGRYGVWSLLFTWLPVGGDTLSFIAGTMKTRIGIFLVLVGIGKFVRYVVIVWTALEVMSATGIGMPDG